MFGVDEKERGSGQRKGYTTLTGYQRLKARIMRASAGPSGRKNTNLKPHKTGQTDKGPMYLFITQNQTIHIIVKYVQSMEYYNILQTLKLDLFEYPLFVLWSNEDIVID